MRLILAILLSAFGASAQMPPRVLDDLSMVSSLPKGGFTYYATKFDGTSDYMSRGAALTGLADGKVGTVSLWIKMDPASNDGSIYCVMGNANSRFRVQRIGGGVLRIFAYDTSGTATLNIRAASTPDALINSSNNWKHFVASWDLANGHKSVFVNGTNYTDVPTFINNNIDYDGGANFAVGSEVGGGSKLPASLCEVYFTTEYLNLTNNIGKFISNMKPVDLGSDGSTPTGTQPLIYLKNPYTSFQANAGSGGNFTVTGALEDAPTKP